MSVRDESAAVRQFAAKPPFPLSKAMSRMITSEARPNWIYFVVMGVALAAVYGGFYFAEHAPAGWEHRPTVAVVGIVLVVSALVYVGWHAAGEIRIWVAGDEVTVKKRHGGVFSFGDATLGLWAYGRTTKTMGSALHLRSGTRHFVLGGRDHRVAAGARLDEPPQGYVDAWLWASDFDELLAIVGHRSTVRAHRPGPDEATRCLLYPNMELAHQVSAWGFGAKQRLWQSASQPLVALDVGGDSIRVIDASNDAVIATAPRAQVTATPETYKCRQRRYGPSYKQPPPSPVLVLRVPGVEPMPIGCQEHRGALDFSSRFAWRGTVPDRVNRPADYSVTAGDWLLLVDEFGLTARLVDRTHRAGG
ncbi:hypothetical protein [Mycobacterium sp. 1081908.1]|uniref:hypothetical protein n=1 Tax=Mycobacterium sp. 1081908.1 TaxID=1834066 RepID=UPI00080185FB|nr:hypothetical protein [Mycobacterium sp. 1081908.1]OBK45902.1 hypothetical protein A5655_10630 [Mycobacterium sp. 1081908.1]